MIYAVTVSVDIQTLDHTLPLKMMGCPQIEPGSTRQIPGGVIVFQSAYVNEMPGEASVYRFVVQFGSLHAGAIAGNWLFSQLYGKAAALQLAGHLVPIDHTLIIRGLQQVA